MTDYEIKDNWTFVISEGVTSIKNFAFALDTRPQSIIIPKSVTSIGNSAFALCRNLHSVIMPEGTVSIGNGAFQESGLRMLVLPECVTSIGKKALYQCSCLQTIGIPEGKINVKAYDGVTMDDKLKLIAMKNYTMKMNHDIKYQLLFQMFSLNADREHLSDYISKNISKMFCWLIGRNETELIQKLLDSGNFITKRNIDKFIRYAIDNEKIRYSFC